MKSIREKFEEVWPVPEGVYWSPVFGAYVCAHGSPVKLECMELNLRLDTFTRCQETTDVYVSLVDELRLELEVARSDEANAAFWAGKEECLHERELQGCRLPR